MPPSPTEKKGGRNLGSKSRDGRGARVEKRKGKVSPPPHLQSNLLLCPCHTRLESCALGTSPLTQSFSPPGGGTAQSLLSAWGGGGGGQRREEEVGSALPPPPLREWRKRRRRRRRRERESERENSRGKKERQSRFLFFLFFFSIHLFLLSPIFLSPSSLYLSFSTPLRGRGKDWG